MTVFGALTGATHVPSEAFPREMSSTMAATIIVMPVLFFGVMLFWMPHSPFYQPRIASLIDARFGTNAFASFLVRLKPLLMFAVGSVLQGVLGLWQDFSVGGNSGAYAIHGFFVSGGIGFALVHAVLFYRRAPGVYPMSADEQAHASVQRSKPERKPLGDALRTYWWTLIGLAAFPTMVTIGESLHVPAEFFALPFFAVAMLAAWPCFSGRAPYSFWIVAGGIWLLGGIVASLLTR
jgi:hypothetical protein